MKEPFRVRRLQLSLSQRLHRKIAVSKRPPVQAWDAKYLPERCYSRRMPRHTRSPAPSSPRQSRLSSSRSFKDLRSQRHFFNIAERLDRPRATSARSRPPATWLFQFPETAATPPRPDCACRGGNSRSPRPHREAFANSRPASPMESVLRPQFCKPGAPKARAHQSEPIFRRGPSAPSHPPVLFLIHPSSLPSKLVCAFPEKLERLPARHVFSSVRISIRVPLLRVASRTQRSGGSTRSCVSAEERWDSTRAVLQAIRLQQGEVRNHKQRA